MLCKSHLNQNEMLIFGVGSWRFCDDSFLFTISQNNIDFILWKLFPPPVVPVSFECWLTTGNRRAKHGSDGGVWVCEFKQCSNPSRAFNTASEYNCYKYICLYDISVLSARESGVLILVPKRRSIEEGKNDCAALTELPSNLGFIFPDSAIFSTTPKWYNPRGNFREKTVQNGSKTEDWQSH